MSIKFFGPFIFFVSLLISCEQDDLPSPDFNPSGGVFVTNEGAFGTGNASVSWYDLADNSIQNNLFANANGRPLGDVLQSMTIVGGFGYLVVNGSGIIQHVSLADFSALASIEGLASPRYMHYVSDSKAYVTDLFGKSVSIVDPSGYSLSGSIPVPAWTENMLDYGNELWVNSPFTNKLYIIDRGSDQLTDSMLVDFNPASMVMDGEEKIWIICGDAFGGIPGGLYRIDPPSRQVIASFPFSHTSTGSRMELKTNESGNILFVLRNHLYALPINATDFPDQPLVPADGRNLYALGIAPVSGEIFLGDAVDFQQAGRVYRYSASGQALGDAVSGVAPNGFVFY